MSDQLELFEMTPLETTNTVMVCGGIYYEKGDFEDEEFDGKYAICFGANKFHFIFEGMDHIENECELACAHRMKLLEGFTLGINKREKKWYIRNSSIKNQNGWIRASGKYLDGFEDSLIRYVKIFNK